MLSQKEGVLLLRLLLLLLLLLVESKAALPLCPMDS